MEILETARKSSPGVNITRPELVLQIFGSHVDRFRLANSTQERQIRDAIADLQEQGYPIIASSGAAGYRLAIDDDERLEYIREIQARIAKLEKKVNALRHPRWSYSDEPVQAIQRPLF
jgi:hypothetical protein